MFYRKRRKKRVIAYDIDYQEYANALNKYCEQLEKALENVISDCDAIGVDWFDSIADIDESSPLLEDCVDRHGWLEGINNII